MNIDSSFDSFVSWYIFYFQDIIIALSLFVFYLDTLIFFVI